MADTGTNILSKEGTNLAYFAPKNTDSYKTFSEIDIIRWYAIQPYVIKFVGDLRQVCDFLRVPPPIKLTAPI
jgi:hypothetical protein